MTNDAMKQMSKFLSAVEHNADLMVGSEGNLDGIQRLFHIQASNTDGE